MKTHAKKNATWVGAAFGLLLPHASQAQTAIPTSAVQSADPQAPVSQVYQFQILPVAADKGNRTLSAYKITYRETTTRQNGEVKIEKSLPVYCNAGSGLGAQVTLADGANSSACINEAPNTSGVYPAPGKGAVCTFTGIETVDYTRLVDAPHGKKAYLDTLALTSTCGDVTESRYFSGPSGIDYASVEAKLPGVTVKLVQYGHLGS